MAEPRQVDDQAVAVPVEERRRIDHGQRNVQPARPPADDREPVAGRAGHGDVAALDDGRLLAGDRRDRVAEPILVVEVDVGHHGHAAVPGVGRVEPAAQSHFHERDVEGLLGEPAEDDRGQQLELGRLAEAAGIRSAAAQDLAHEPGEVVGRDGAAVDHQSLAIGHEVRLGRLADAQPGGPQRGTGERQHAALAVRPGHERAAQSRAAGRRARAGGPGPGRGPG